MARYEFVEGSSSKFWEITLDGKAFTTTYGKIGTAGQSTTKAWKDEATAKKEHDKLVAEKTKKGYKLTGDAPAAAPAEEPKATSKSKKKEAAPAPSAPASTVAAPAATMASGAQRYELIEGSSSKFWEITLDGKAFTTTYGKIGTAGQSTTKEWKDEATARREHDKLVAEKTKKGYSPVAGAGGSGGGGAAPPSATAPAPAAGAVVHPKAGTAFRMADLEQLHARPHEHAETFMGCKVVEYDPEEGIKDAARRAWRIGLTWDGDGDEPELGTWLARWKGFVEDPAASKVKAIVVGSWMDAFGGGEGPGGKEATKLLETIASAAPRLPALAALFICDIMSEENELSWQNLADVSPIVKAFPGLQHLRVRGNPSSKKMGALRSDRLRSLQFEGTNNPQAVVDQVAAADLPALEHLEVWLGDDNYAHGRKDVDSLAPILSGKLFPSLRYLGLRQSDIADDVARAVAQAPIMDRLEVLDLSLGTLADEGAEALLASPAVARLKKLDISHHFVGPDLIKKLRAHLKGGKLVESRAEDQGGGPDDRYVAIGE